MFQIDKNDIPFLRTRAAILILDVQNDIVAPDGILKVNQPPDFLDKIYNLVPAFRSWGQIMWIITQYEKHRPINDGSADAESVITDNKLLKEGQRARQRERMAELLNKMHPRSSDRDEADTGDDGDSQTIDVDEEDEEEHGKEEEEANETYLTLGPDQEPKCCIPMSLGVNFHTSMLQGPQNGLNSLTDLIFGKTHYSAFKSGALIQRLRSSMVTELFICGALTNISIYATVLDAVCHGYSITIISDCCGYKSEARHNEAIRQMTEVLGCETMTSLEMIEEIEARGREANKKRMKRRTKQGGKLEQSKGKTKAIEDKSTREIDDMMGKLDLEDGKVEVSPFRPQPETIKSHLWEVKAEFPTSRSADRVKPPRKFVSPSLPGIEPSINKIRVKSKVSARRRPSKSKPEDESSASTTLPGSTAPLSDLREHESLAGESKVRAVDTQKKNKIANIESPAIGDDKSNLESTKTSMALESHKPVRSVPFCEGDSEMITDLFPETFADQFFENLLEEVIWQKMLHQGGDVPRLIAVQGLVSRDGTHPIYRHPSDESPPLHPFSDTVRRIIPYVESALGHAVNHVLIQFYRNGTDHITEHSDKTLDIVPETFIANVSLGALRTMTFRTKKPITPTDQSDTDSDGVHIAPKTVAQSNQEKPAIPGTTPRKKALTESAPRKSHKEHLPHNSMCKFGLKSNAVWLHGIRPDRRKESEKASEVIAFNGSRISLTFRKIGTFLNRDQTLIWGQGAVSKDEKNAREVISGDTEAAQQMLKAFGKENKMSEEFVWKSEYGGGFDVLHIKNERKLVLGGVDGLRELRVKILLRELRVEVGVCGEGDLMRPIRLDAHGREISGPSRKKSIIFVDNDAKRSRVEGDTAIFLYLERVYGLKNGNDFDLGKCFTRLLQADKPLLSIREELSTWESFILEYGNEGHVAGVGLSLVDYFFWPALHCLQGHFRESQILNYYYERVGERDGFRWVNEAVSDSD